jgi:hypothetical protein
LCRWVFRQVGQYRFTFSSGCRTADAPGLSRSKRPNESAQARAVSARGEFKRLTVALIESNRQGITHGYMVTRIKNTDK